MLRRLRQDSGAATVEFTLVAGLLMLVVISLVQLTLASYVRNVVVDAAGEGARYGALLGGDANAAVERTELLISTSVSAEYAQNVTADYVLVDDVVALQVRVSTPVPVIGLIGVSQVTVEGHGIVEGLE